jgi:uncharacterized protein YraI
MAYPLRRHPRIVRAAVIGIVCAIGGAGLGLAAKQLWVKVAYVDIRQGAMDAYPVIGQAKQGEALNVIETQDNWAHVQYNAMDGWVDVSELSDTPTSGVTFSQYGSSTAAGAQNANAGRGAFPDEHQYAQAKGYDEKPLNAFLSQYDLEEHGTVIAPDRLKSFWANGKVGPKQYRGANPM